MNILDDEKAANDLVYHYTRKYVAIENILYSKALRLSPFKYTNDPVEYKEWSFTVSGTAHCGKIPAGFFTNDFIQVDRQINELVKSRYKIGCFCRDKWEPANRGYQCIERGFARSRMWSQYADNHEGVCLVFSKAKITDDLSKGHGDTMQYFQGDVSYVKQPNTAGIRARSISGDDLQESGVESYVMDHVRKNVDSLFLTKNLDYRDEREYRVVLYEQNDEYFMLPIAKSLIGVVVGDRFPSVYSSVIKELLDSTQAFCLRLKWHNEKPYLSESV